MHTGQHHIQNDGIEPAGQRRGDTLGPGKGHGGANALAREILGQHSAQVWVVIDQKNVQ